MVKSMKLDPDLPLYIKINSVDQQLKHKSQNLKPLRRKQIGDLHDIRFGSGFLNIIPKA